MKLAEIKDARPRLIMAIGPSGSGKSTLFRKLKAENPNLEVFSLDLLRHEFYDPKDYARAWKMSVEDKTFLQRANQRFLELLKQRKDLFVDNTNLTPKSRKFYLEQAKNMGFKTIAYVFNVDLDTLIARQTTRGDKNVPAEAVRQQFSVMKRPVENEFDEVYEVE